MVSPHESLNLNAKRGLLAAVNGNPATEPGWVAFYDLHKDCRHPELTFSGPLARPATRAASPPTARRSTPRGTAYKSITAIDVTDPKMPFVVWQGDVQSHGLSLSPDGNRAYLANPDVEFGDLDDPRHQPDPGAQAQPAHPRDQPHDVGTACRSPRTASVHQERPSVRARVR